MFGKDFSAYLQHKMPGCCFCLGSGFTKEDIGKNQERMVDENNNNGETKEKNDENRAKENFLLRATKMDIDE